MNIELLFQTAHVLVLNIFTNSWTRVPQQLCNWTDS